MAHLSLYDSAHRGDFEIVKSRVDANPALIYAKDSSERLLIHWAAISDNTRLVLYLLDRGSQIDPEDDTKLTPLILACSAGKYSTCELLISRGANVHHRNIHGHTSLQYACSKGWEEIASLLLQAGADVNVADIRSATPLHRSASKGLTSIVKLLLKHPGINVNVADFYGNTPLHLACEEDRFEEIHLLHAAGAEIDATNKENKTTWDVGNYDVKKLLDTLKADQKK